MNHKSKTHLLLPIFAFALMMCSCTQQIYHPGGGIKPDGQYDLAFPTGNNSEALEAALQSVRLLNSTAYYESYDFAESEKILPEDITPQLLAARDSLKTVYSDFAVGTATIIYRKQNRIAVLTCAHVVNFPDTLLVYHLDREGNETYLQSISIKKSQRNSLTDLRQGSDLNILAIDQELDVAILGKQFLFSQESHIPVFPYPTGAARELKWGSFVYLIGFPAGKKMITTGVISEPDRDANHDFLVDALFNRGFSGGVVLAIRDGLPNLELVGIVNAVAAEESVVLVPEDFKNRKGLRFAVPHRGGAYQLPQRKINYGVTYGISIESINAFIQKHKDQIENAGFDLALMYK